MPFCKKQLISNISSLQLLSILLLNWWSLSRWPLCSDPFNRSKEQMQTWTLIIKTSISFHGSSYQQVNVQNMGDPQIPMTQLYCMRVVMDWFYDCSQGLYVCQIDHTGFFQIWHWCNSNPRWNCPHYMFVNIVQGVGCWHLVQNSSQHSFFLPHEDLNNFTYFNC